MSKKSTLAAALIILGSCAAYAQSDNFLADAIQINLAEIAAGNLAEKNGGTDDVKAFGKMLVEDHTAANEKAKTLAQAKGVTAPNEPKPEDQNTADDLAKLSGPQFDQKFAEAMVKGHKAAIGKFEVASKGNDEVAKFAQETLPNLQKHLEQAKSLAAKKTAAEDVKHDTAQTGAEPSDATLRKEAAMPSGQKTTEMIGTLPTQTLPVSDYYNQSVYDNRDNKIGDVNDLLLDKNGKVDAVIIGVGGFLGLGEKNVAVAFPSLRVAEKNGNRYLVLETTKETLQTAPGYTYDRTNKTWVPATKQG